MKLTEAMILVLGVLALAGCNSPSEQPKDKDLFGLDWQAKQASYEAACVAKGHSAAVCQQTNSADEYTDEYRQSMLMHGAAISQCLESSVESCRLIVNKNVGQCMFFAIEVIDPSDSAYRAETKEVCALELQIIREATASGAPVAATPKGGAFSGVKAVKERPADQISKGIDGRSDCIKKQLGNRFNDAITSEILKARKKCGIVDPADTEEQLRKQRERLSQ